jgi:hypothetical protein
MILELEPVRKTVNVCNFRSHQQQQKENVYGVNTKFSGILSKIFAMLFINIKQSFLLSLKMYNGT